MPLSVSVEAGYAVQVSGLPEGGQHDRAGDPGVGGDVQGVAGVVVEPGDDLHVRAGRAVGAGEPVVGEVGLPGLVGLLGLEPDVGGLGSLGRVGGHRAGADQDPVDRGPRQRDLVVVVEVPADGVRAGVQAGLGRAPCAAAGPARPWPARSRSVMVFGRRERGSNAASPSASVAGHELVDPGPGDPVGAGDLGLGRCRRGQAVMTRRAFDMAEPRPPRRLSPMT